MTNIESYRIEIVSTILFANMPLRAWISAAFQKQF